MKLLFALAILPIALFGCSDQSGPDPQTEAKREVAATKVRAIYDKANGNWDALTDLDKSALLKEFDNNENNAHRMWDLIKSKSAPSAPTAPPPPGASSSLGSSSQRPDGG